MIQSRVMALYARNAYRLSAGVAHLLPPPLTASCMPGTSVQQPYKEPKSVLFAALLNAYSHPPPVAKLFGSLLKIIPIISAFPLSLACVIPLVILFVNRTNELWFSVPGLLPIPLYPVSLHFWLFLLVPIFSTSY